MPKSAFSEQCPVDPLPQAEWAQAVLQDLKHFCQRRLGDSQQQPEVQQAVVPVVQVADRFAQYVHYQELVVLLDPV